MRLTRRHNSRKRRCKCSLTLLLALIVCLAILLLCLLLQWVPLESIASITAQIIQTNGLKTHDGSPPGVFLLGMHRSGTSALCRLLTQSFDLVLDDADAAGSDKLNNVNSSTLIGGRFANAQGYYERTDVVWQNSHWLEQLNLSAFSHVKRLQRELSVQLQLQQQKDSTYLPLDGNGTHVIDFLMRQQARMMHSKEQEPSLLQQRQQPWLVKDPRLSLTLPLWLHHWRKANAKQQDPHFADPAIIILYRHPVQVAWSLHNRDNCDYNRAFGLYVVYHQLALQDSAASKCRIFVSNHDLRTRPRETLRYISKKLQECDMNVGSGGMEKVKSNLFPSYAAASQHVTLQRDQQFLPDCTLDYKDRERPLDIRWKFLNLTMSSSQQVLDKKRVRQAMLLYCDIQSGRAMQDDYVNGNEWNMLELA
ncbi:hypothetical protein MPSEU_000871300 [Mayamaea pseudoterrestris]|nr:hypothetical protein MPSEU_000871300 [Mayamaea pseudoterrestris]